MAITTTFILPLSLAVFGNVLADNPSISFSQIQSLDEKVLIQCTEVTLQYKAGNKVKNTTSNDCE